MWNISFPAKNGIGWMFTEIHSIIAMIWFGKKRENSDFWESLPPTFLLYFIYKMVEIYKKTKNKLVIFQSPLKRLRLLHKGFLCFCLELNEKNREKPRVLRNFRSVFRKQFRNFRVIHYFSPGKYIFSHSILSPNSDKISNKFGVVMRKITGYKK